MTLYNYYENRGAIIREALGKGLGQLWEGLPEEVAARRAEGGGPLRAYRALADHLLAFALARPRLCRFILTEGAAGDWSARDGQIESICGPGGSAWPETLRRDIYLFELIVFALALKVVGGGETAESYRELSGQGYALLLGRHEETVAQSSM
jgi:AcrR family transcriptional regulator